MLLLDLYVKALGLYLFLGLCLCLCLSLCLCLCLSLCFQLGFKQQFDQVGRRALVGPSLLPFLFPSGSVGARLCVCIGMGVRWWSMVGGGMSQ